MPDDGARLPHYGFDKRAVDNLAHILDVYYADERRVYGAHECIAYVSALLDVLYGWDWPYLEGEMFN